MSGRLNLNVEAGTTFRRVLTWGIGVQDAQGNWVVAETIDVTGYSARMQVRKFPEASEVLLQLTSDDYITMGGTDGHITITFPPEATDDLDFDVGHYDLELQSPGGVVTRFLMGRFGLSRQVTREAVVVSSAGDGGLPVSTFDSGMDGGEPNSVFDGTVDGGSL